MHTFNKLYTEIAKAFREKFKDWKEEDHEASKLLSEMINHGNS